MEQDRAGREAMSELYMPERRAASEMTLAQVKRGLCARAGGDVAVCRACPARCAFGRQAIRLEDMPPEAREAQETAEGARPEGKTMRGIMRAADAERRRRKAMRMAEVRRLEEKGLEAAEICRQVGISMQTYKRYKQEETDMSNQEKAMEKKAEAMASILKPEPKVDIISVRAAGAYAKYLLEEDGRVRVEDLGLELNESNAAAELREFARELQTALQTLEAARG